MLKANLLINFFPDSRFKDGKEVKADANIKIIRDIHRSESYSLVLNIVKGSDSGDYEVKVVNTMGSVTSKSRVIVQGKHLDLFLLFFTLKIFIK